MVSLSSAEPSCVEFTCRCRWSELSWAEWSDELNWDELHAWVQLSWAGWSGGAWAQLRWAALIWFDLSWADLSGAELSWTVVYEMEWSFMRREEMITTLLIRRSFIWTIFAVLFSDYWITNGLIILTFCVIIFKINWFHLLIIIDMNWWLNAGGKIQLLAPVSRSWLTNWKRLWRGMYHIATWTSTMNAAHTITCPPKLITIANRKGIKSYNRPLDKGKD